MPKKKQLNVPGIDAEIYDKAKNYAHQDDKRLTQLVRDFLRRWVAKKDNQAQKMRSQK